MFKNHLTHDIFSKKIWSCKRGFNLYRFSIKVYNCLVYTFKIEMVKLECSLLSRNYPSRILPITASDLLVGFVVVSSLNWAVECCKNVYLLKDKFTFSA